MRLGPTIITGLIIVSILVVGVLQLDSVQLSRPGLLVQNQSISDLESNSNNASAPGKESSLNDPFYQLTIPYLRNRTYSSYLNELDRLADTKNYTSYLTSYNSDDLKINGLLTIPTGQQPADGWPAVVFIHGYIPPNQYQTTEKYEDYIDYLARNGLVVFKIDLRGHGQSEGQPGGAYFSADYVIDTLNAMTALANSEFVDDDRIGLWGHSMAGNVVLRSIAAKPNIPAAVIWAGAVYTYEDMQEYGISDYSYQRPPENSPRNQEREQLFRQHDRSNLDSPFWQQVIPTNYLDDVTTAVQLHHATNDSVVSVEYSRNLMNILDNTDIPHQLYEYSSGGHNITGSSFTTAMQRTVEFYQNQL